MYICCMNACTLGAMQDHIQMMPLLVSRVFGARSGLLSVKHTVLGLCVLGGGGVCVELEAAWCSGYGLVLPTHEES